jgi:hypothetical protein
MQPTENNRMDQLGREAAENYQAPVAPDWDNFLPRLDEALPQKEKKRRRFLLFWLLLGLTVGGTGIYFLLQPTTTNKAIAKPAAASIELKTPVSQSNGLTKETTTEKAKQPANKKVTISIKENTIAETRATKKYTPKNNYNNNTIKTTQKFINATAATSTQQQNKKNTGKPYTSEPKKAIANKVVTMDTKTTEKSIAITNNQKDTETIATKTASSLLSEADKNNNASNDLLVNNAISDSATTTIPPTAVAVIAPVATPAADSNKAITSNKKPAPKAKEKNIFSLAVVTGFDWSTVKYDYAEPLGINIGIIGGYHLNKRWSLHSGLIYTHKRYEANGQNFSPKDKNPWYNTIKMMHVDGYCNMLEWPVYARYIFNPLKKQTYFISTGIASYKINKENYNYTYTYNTGTTVYNKQSVRNDKDIYLASILHLSAGASFTAGKKINILAEPYAKLPLRKMGYGSLMLSSFGINFSLQLKQPQKK